ncbi:uncharacterized protein UV8b_04803 [Ustilaginoidea virens]|uniref:Uncharacterized protein n=1 Tax=Ustilaginoidea virens TaxID=1159556 RepID=A0A8E5HS91_USTVR|nr:uncharacterized protein UV8b_04803 [Ustilaginoidea virens]QUC20562.1 hypothetical protein UV8b_04803 [Ustilaginoidea virens]
MNSSQQLLAAVNMPAPTATANVANANAIVVAISAIGTAPQAMPFSSDQSQSQYRRGDANYPAFRATSYDVLFNFVFEWPGKARLLGGESRGQKP